MAGQSQITTALRPDAPLVQNAGYQLDGVDRQKIDDQIVGCQQHLADSLINGVIASWFTVDGASVALGEGDVFCLASTTTGSVTLATPSAMATAGIVLGIALQAAGPGSKVRGAIAGLVSASYTALASGASGVARLSTTGRVQVVASYVLGDCPLGFVDAAGWLTLVRAYPIGSVNVGALVASVGATAPATSTGGLNPVIGVVAASALVQGSLSANDYKKIQALAPGAYLPLIPGITEPPNASPTANIVDNLVFARSTGASLITSATAYAMGPLVASDTNYINMNVYDLSPTNVGLGPLAWTDTRTSASGGSGNWTEPLAVFSWVPVGGYVLAAGHRIVVSWGNHVGAGVAFPGVTWCIF